MTISTPLLATMLAPLARPWHWWRRRPAT